MDTLLDEQVLVGAGRQSFETLRPLAYSTLADLVHHVRANLKLPQLSWVVHIYCRNIHDASLPVTIQTTSVRLLLNLTDYIFHNHDPDSTKGKGLLVKILKTLVHKFDTLRDYMEHVDETERLRSFEHTQSAQGTKRQLAEMMKARQAIRAEALSSTVVVGVPETELDKNLYGVVSVEAHPVSDTDGALFGNGEWDAFRTTVGPKGGLSGTIQDSSLLGFARGVLRQSHGIAPLGPARGGGEELDPPSLPSSVVEHGSQLYLARGTITFMINAATEAGFPRRLCVRRLEIITSRWDPSKVKVRLRLRGPNSSNVPSSISSSTSSSSSSSSSTSASSFAASTETDTPKLVKSDSKDANASSPKSSKNGSTVWTEATELKVEKVDGLPLVLVTLDEDTVCSGLQLILSIDADGAEDADKPKSKKAAAAAAAAAATLSDKFKVALHELRLIGGDAKAVREAEEKAALDTGGVRDDRPQGDALDPAALILDPNQLNQKALAQVMRRTGPVTHVAGLGISTAVTGGRIQRLPSSVVGGASGSNGATTMDSLRDLKGLIKIMMMGLQRNVLWCICNYDANRKRAASSVGSAGGGINLSAGSALSATTSSSAVASSSSAANNKDEKRPYILSAEERNLVTKFFQWGLACVHAYIRGLDASKSSKVGGASAGSLSGSSSQSVAHPSPMSSAEVKDILECFAYSFTVMEPHNFRSTIGRQMPLLFDHVMTSPQLFSVAQILLANPSVSATFADVLLSFLVSCLSELGAADPDAKLQLNNSVLRPSGAKNSESSETEPLVTPMAPSVSMAGLPQHHVEDIVARSPNKAPGSVTAPDSISSSGASGSNSVGGGGGGTPSSPMKGGVGSMKQSPAQRASILLQFFKIVFGSVAIFPENENMVRQHVHELVLATLRLVGHTRRPIGFFSLLRSLFRSLSGVYGGHFEASYDELRPLLPALVNGLLRLRASASDPKHMAILVELCLTIPARVEHLLPYLPLLTPVVTHALRVTGELAKLGLRTLEFWIDQLNPGEIDTGIAHTPEDLSELMIAVCAHLRPSPYPYGTLAIRILGKLGGRNRRFLRELIAMPSSVSAPLDADASAPFDYGARNVGVEGLETAAVVLALSWDGLDASAEMQNGASTAGGAGGAGLVRIKDFQMPLDGVIKNVVKLFERFTQLDAAAAPNASDKTDAEEAASSQDKDNFAMSMDENIPETSKHAPHSATSISTPWPVVSDVRPVLATNMKQHKMHCFRFCIAILSGLLSPPSSTNGSSSGGAGTDQKMHFSTRVGDAERNADDLIVDLLKESSDDGAQSSLLLSEARTAASALPRGHSRADALLRSLLRALVLAASDTELSAEATPLLQGGIAHFCGILASRTVDVPPASAILAASTATSEPSSGDKGKGKEKPNEDKGGDDYNIGIGMGEDDLGPGVELDPVSKDGQSLDPFSLNAVLLEMLCCGHQRRANAAMWAIKEVIRTARAIECDRAGAADEVSKPKAAAASPSSSSKTGKKMSKKAEKALSDAADKAAKIVAFPNKRDLWGKLVVQNLLDGICRLCREREMRYKEGAYRAIQELCAVDSGLGLAQWIITSQNTILKALLFCLEDHPREVSLLVIDDVVLSLNAMFSLCYESTTTSDATKETSRSGLRAVVRTLASHLTSTKVAVRVGVKRALHDLAVKIYPASTFRAGASEAVDPAQGMARLLLPCTSLLRRAILNEGNDGWKKVGTSGSSSSSSSSSSTSGTSTSLSSTSFMSLRPIQQVGILDALTFVLMLPKVTKARSAATSADKDTPDSTVKRGKVSKSESPKRGRKRGRPSKKEDGDDDDDVDGEGVADDELSVSVMEMGPDVLSLLSEVVTLCSQDNLDNTGALSAGSISDVSGSKREDGGGGASDSSAMAVSSAAAEDSEGDSGSRAFDAAHPLNQPTQRGVRKVAAGEMKNAIKGTTSNDLCIIQACWPAELPLGVQVRMAACRALHAALKAGGDKFATGGAFSPPQSRKNWRSSFIGVFFKFLTGSSELVVDVATTALTFVITSPNHKKDKPLPKELLQECLKPVLSQVKSHKNLTRQLLSGLNRLLYLISAYFNKSLGEKLLEHLKEWEQPEAIAALNIWRPGEEPEIAAAIVGLFYLLPISPDFLPPLVTTVLRLEATLHRFAQSAAASAAGYASGGGAASPYREPLLKFLNRHNSDTVAYFLQEKQLRDPAHIDLFQDLLKHPRAGPLRERFASKQGSLLFCQVFFPAGLRALADILPETAVTQAPAKQSAGPTPGSIGTMASESSANGESSAMQIDGDSPVISSAEAVSLSADATDGTGSDSKAGAAPSNSAAKNMDTEGSKNFTSAASMPVPALAFELAAHAAAINGGDGVVISLDLEQPISMRTTQASSSSATNSGAEQSSSSNNNTASVEAAFEAHMTATAARWLAEGALSRDQVEVQYQGLLMLQTLTQFYPSFVAQRPALALLLRVLWRSPGRKRRFEREWELPLHQQEESRLLVLSLVAYCRERPGEALEVLFELLSVFLKPRLTDYTFLKDFYRDEVALKWKAPCKRGVVVRFLRMLREERLDTASGGNGTNVDGLGGVVGVPGNSESDDEARRLLKVLALQLIVTPTLAGTFESRHEPNREVVDEEIIRALMRDALDTSALPHYDEALRIELLRLATLLIEHLGRELVDHRKELIKFAWNHLKSEDSTSKQWAYVNVCRFIAVYETPPKIILQVYVALLRAYQPEMKELVKTALDILVPALPRRLPPAEFVKAIKWTRKIMYEEDEFPQLVHMWQLIVRHPALFYSYRQQFVPQMAQVFNRVGRFPNCPLDNRTLAVGLAELIIEWEIHRKERLRSSGRVNGTSPRAGASLKRASDSTTSATGVTKVKVEDVGDGTQRVVASSTLAPAPGTKSNADKMDTSVPSEPKVASDATQIRPPSGAAEIATGATAAPPQRAATPSSSSVTEDDSTLQPQMVWVVLDFLVRISLFTAVHKDPNVQKLTPRCVELFGTALKVWDTRHIKLSYFEKLLNNASTQLRASEQQAINATNKGGSGQDSSATNNATQQQGTFTPAELSTCLDVLIAMLDTNEEPNDFVVTHIAKIQLLLGPCFKLDELGIQRKLQRLLERLTRLHPPSRLPPSFVESNFYPRLKDLMERKLQIATTERPDDGKHHPGSGQHHSSSSHQHGGGAGGGSSAATGHHQTSSSSGSSQAGGISSGGSSGGGSYGGASGLGGTKCSAFPVVRVLRGLCEDSPAYIEHHASALVKLCHRIARDHVTVTTQTARALQGASSLLSDLGPSKMPPRVMATPTMALLAEANFAASAGQYPNPPLADEALTTLTEAVRLLGSAMSQFEMKEVRKAFFRLVEGLLMQSDNVPLLIALVDIVGAWVVPPPGRPSPLSPKERMNFMSRLMHFPRVPEPSAVPLVGRFLRILQRINLDGNTGGAVGAGDSLYVPKIASESSSASLSSSSSSLSSAVVAVPSQPSGSGASMVSDAHSVQTWLKSPGITQHLGRAQMLGLMAADPVLRCDFLAAFIRQADRDAPAFMPSKGARSSNLVKPTSPFTTASAKPDGSSESAGTASQSTVKSTSTAPENSAAVADTEMAVAAAMDVKDSDVTGLIPDIDAAVASSMDIDESAGTTATASTNGPPSGGSAKSESKTAADDTAVATPTGSGASPTAVSAEGTLFQRLLFVLKSDWEVLGVRYWLVVAVEALFSSVDATKPITLHGPKRGGKEGLASLRRLASPVLATASDVAMSDDEGDNGDCEDEKNANGGSAARSMTVRTFEGSQAHLEATRSEVYRLHRLFLDSLADNALAQNIFAPLASLAHADIGLAEELWRVLMPAAWRSLPTQRQEALVQPLGALLAKPFLRPCLGLPAPQAMMPAGGQIGKLPAGGYSQLASSWGWAAFGTGLDIGTGHNGTQSGGALGPAPPPPNVVRSILGVVTELRPVPVLLPDLLSGLAASHNAWHVVLQVMEHQALATVPSERLDWVRCLALVYEELGESDRLRALQQRACAARESHVALSLEAYGHAATAQKLYLELITQENSGRGVGKKLSSVELELWETRWVECARQLAQWPLLCDFSRSVKQHELTMECAWKGHDWGLVRELLRSPSLIAALELGSPRHKLYEIYMSIVDGKFGDVEHHCNQCIQLALHRWSQLPPLATADGAHNGLLRLFHQLVEVHESGQIMLEVSQHTRNHQHHHHQQQQLQQQGQHHQAPPPPPPDFKYIIHTWRNRLPNKWDPIPEWDDLFCWRHWVFKATSDAFRQRTQEHPQQLLRLHDTPWTVLKLAHTARKLRLEDVALSSLSRLYDTPHMDVSDAYTKLREQILMCHPFMHAPNASFAAHMGGGSSSIGLPVELTAAKTQQMLRGGLSLVNNTNLEYFNDTQRAELFRLKGTFLALLGRGEPANLAYSHAAQISHSYGKNWLAWGEYCHELFSSTNILTYAQQGIGCYLQALKFCNATKKGGKVEGTAADGGGKGDRGHAKTGTTSSDGSGGAVGRLVVARILHLLSFDDEKKSLALTFEMYAKYLPAATWLPWISILLSGLVRNEAPQIRGILVIVGQKYPQALYYSLRAFLLERRESSAAAAAEAAQPSSSSVASSAAASSSSESGEAKNGMDVEDDQSNTSKTSSGVASGGAASGAARVGSSAGSTHHANELMSWLRRGHLGLVTDMENMLEEIILCFRPEPEEELLSAVHALLMKCYQITHMSLTDPLPASMAPTLHRVYRKFFHSGVITRSSKPSHKRFIGMFRDAFERDFATQDASLASDGAGGSSSLSGAKPMSSLTLMDVVQRLRKWRHVLQTLVHRVPLRVPLAEVAPRLASLWNDYDLPSSSWNALGIAAALKSRNGTGTARGGGLLSSVGGGNALVGGGSSGDSTSLNALDLYGSSGTGGSTGAGYSARVAIEIPGQYFKAATSSMAPRPELHTKLVRFGSYVHFESRAASLSRRLTMLGSDGKARHWLVQMTLTHITRRDERMAHMTMVLNDILARNPQTRRRHVSLGTLTVVPITPRMRLLEDDATFTTLHDVYESHCAAEGTDPDAELIFSREQLARIPKKPTFPAKSAAATAPAAPGAATSATPTPTGVASAAASTTMEAGGVAGSTGGAEKGGTVVAAVSAGAASAVAAPGAAGAPASATSEASNTALLERHHAQLVLREKLRIYTEICQRVPDDLLSRHVHASLQGDAEALWALKRALAMQLATVSLLCHAFTAGDRSPQRFVFSKKTGRFVASEFRPVYRPEGQMEPSEDVPFRLTRNIMTLLSPLLVDGVFASSMATTALAVSEKSATLKPYLTLILRDDLMSWHASKMQPQTDAEQRRNEAQLAERVSKNVKHALDRVQTAAPRLSHSGGRVHREHRVDHIAHRLIEAAAQPERLCQMNPTWMPWL